MSTFALEIDATALAERPARLHNAGANRDAVHPNLLAWDHTLQGPAGDGVVVFTVGDDGMVGYKAELEGVLSGRGTGRLGVKGAAVVVDATALFVPSVLLDSITQELTAAPFTRVFLPGGHNLQGAGGEGVVLFTVSDDGTVGYDPALEGVLSGKGTGRLVVKGGTVAVDATALFVPGVLVTYLAAAHGDALHAVLLARRPQPPGPRRRRRRSFHCER